MSLLYLYFGHLLGDYVFQPDKLIIWKQKSWKGVFVHASVHFLTELILFLPFLIWMHLPIGTFFAAVGFIALMHFCIDSMKLKLERKKKYRYLKLYLLDQLLHFIVLLFSSFFLSAQLSSEAIPGTLMFLLNPAVICYFMGLILVTYAYEATVFQIAREGNEAKVFTFAVKPMIIRSVIFTMSYWLALAAFTFPFFTSIQ